MSLRQSHLVNLHSNLRVSLQNSQHLIHHRSLLVNHRNNLQYYHHLNRQCNQQLFHLGSQHPTQHVSPQLNHHCAHHHNQRASQPIILVHSRRLFQRNNQHYSRLCNHRYIPYVIQQVNPLLNHLVYRLGCHQHNLQCNLHICQHTNLSQYHQDNQRANQACIRQRSQVISLPFNPLRFQACYLLFNLP